MTCVVLFSFSPSTTIRSRPNTEKTHIPYSPTHYSITKQLCHMYNCLRQ